MRSNLKSAKQAIEAELSYARQGIAYYTACVESLEGALQQLESVEDAESVPPEGGTSKIGVKKSKTMEARRAGASQRASANGSSRKRGNETRRNTRQRTAGRPSEAAVLPTTGGDFWLNLIGTQPQSAVDIANAAIATLGIKADQKDKIQKLKQRVSPALANLVTAQKIQDSGAGRERRFFKNENQSAQ
jgi:hypothetical protein